MHTTENYCAILLELLLKECDCSDIVRVVNSHKNEQLLGVAQFKQATGESQSEAI